MKRLIILATLIMAASANAQTRHVLLVALDQSTGAEMRRVLDRKVAAFSNGLRDMLLAALEITLNQKATKLDDTQYPMFLDPGDVKEWYKALRSGEVIRDPLRSRLRKHLYEGLGVDEQDPAWIPGESPKQSGRPKGRVKKRP